MIRTILALVLACLVLGCMESKQETGPQHVCPGGQVVASAELCPETQTTTTLAFQPTITSTSTSATSTTSTTSTTMTVITTTTLCEHSIKGYLILTDQDERCYQNYRFRLDSQKWNCEDRRAGCMLNIIVTRPNGDAVAVSAHRTQDGVGTTIDGLSLEIPWTREENGMFIAALRVT
ncbi:MAG: hypothetical protein V1744_00665 [Candidatus Altiarchaeota archaeon]